MYMCSVRRKIDLTPSVSSRQRTMMITTRRQQRSSVTVFLLVAAAAATVLLQAHAFAPSPLTSTTARAVFSKQQTSSFLHSSSRQNALSVSPHCSRSSSRLLTLPASTKSEEQAAATEPHLVASNAPPLQVTIEKEDYSYNEAIQRTLAWVSSAIIFGGGLWGIFGSETGQEFFAGYLVEQSLSVDNLFVFLLLFEYFKVPLAFQDRVLNWGIYGAIVMRAIMIGIGAAALQQFHGILLVFAGILVYSSAKFFFGAGDDEEEDPSQNSIVKFSHSLFKSSDHFDGDRFFTLVDGVRHATPLFICMIAVEISDVVFAVDSIPAVFGVTENPLVVFSSNIFAIMGLRSLYTILSKAATDLKYLEPSVAVVLGFIGAKMIAEYFGYNIPTQIALSVVATLLGSGIGLSVLDKQKELEKEDISIAALDDNHKSS